ncbi:MAG: CHASE domain-containing protein, partial [Spirochaetota bacterium]
MPEPAGAPGSKPSAFPWLPLVVGLLLCALVFFLWGTLESREQANLRSKVQAQADFLASHIEADLRSRLPALQRMARSWELRQGTAKEEFVNESLSYLADVPGFHALEWVDRDAFVRWIVPREGNEKALDLNLAFEKSRREAMARSLATGQSAATPPIDLVQGGKGFLAFFPLVNRRQADGWILAVFRIGEWLDYSFGIKTAQSVVES